MGKILNIKKKRKNINVYTEQKEIVIFKINNIYVELQNVLINAGRIIKFLFFFVANAIFRIDILLIFRIVLFLVESLTFKKCWDLFMKQELSQTIF